MTRQLRACKFGDNVVNAAHTMVVTLALKSSSSNETPSKSTVTSRCQKVWPLHVNLPLFWRPPIANSIDEQDNDYMMNWPYFSNETSSKSTVTNRCQKVWPLHVNLAHFGRPPIAHTIDVYNNDYMMNWPYFCNETSSKSTVTSRCQKVWPQHPNLPLFWRPPYSTLYCWT